MGLVTIKWPVYTLLTSRVTMQKVIATRNGQKRANSTPTANCRSLVGVNSSKGSKTCKVLDKYESTSLLPSNVEFSNEQMYDIVQCNNSGHAAVPSPLFPS